MEPSIDVLTTRSLGRERSSDQQLLEFAAQTGRVILTHDLNTMVGFAYERIKAAERMSGLIAVPQRLAVRTAIDHLLLIWFAAEAEEICNEVIYLPI